MIENIKASKRGTPHIETEYWLLIFNSTHLVFRDKKEYTGNVLEEPVQLRALMKKFISKEEIEELIELTVKIFQGELIWVEDRYVPTKK